MSILSESSQQLQDYLSLASECARQAGALLLEGFEQQHTIDHKSSSIDWVTEFDKASEALIVERLVQAMPSHGIVGEEGSRREGQGGYAWYIDPLDGTTNYAHHFPVFAVSIALYRDTTPLVGVVYDPLRQELFSAAAGQGAFLASPAGQRSLRVTSTQALGASLLATGFPYDHHTSQHNNVTELAAFLRQAHGIRRAGSAALDIAYVAAGRLDGYWEFKLYPWDMAAAQLLVLEAGGRFTQPDGSATVLEEKMSACVSNGLIHEQMLAVLAQAAAQRGC